MDSELVRDSGSDGITGGGDNKRLSPSLTTAKLFEQYFPFYLALGMTYDQYWDGDCTMTKAYRKAYELKKEMNNEAAWLQGLYIYEALCCVAPIFRFSTKPAKPVPYRGEPFPLKTEFSDKRQEQKREINDNKAKSVMEAFMVTFNRRFEKKGG